MVKTPYQRMLQGFCRVLIKKLLGFYIRSVDLSLSSCQQPVPADAAVQPQHQQGEQIQIGAAPPATARGPKDQRGIIHRPKYSTKIILRYFLKVRILELCQKN